MKKCLMIVLVTLLVVALSSIPSHALTRIVANFHFSDECFSSVAPSPGGGGGTVCYSRTFSDDPGIDTLFIEVTGTADTHNGADNMVACLLDGVPCRPEASFSSGLSGWLVWQKAAPTADLHDNSVVSRWCTQVPADFDFGGIHTLTVKIASRPGGGANSAFLEGYHVTVDEEFTGGGCTAL